MPRSFNEFTYYSPEHDCRMARISMVDGHNQEYFAFVDAEVPGSVYRERRQKACEAIDAAISEGRDPGEVKLCED